MKTQPHHKSGFTLVELLVSVTIIVILIAIGATSFTAFNKRAKKAKSEALVEALENSINSFHDKYNRFPFPPSVNVSYSNSGGNLSILSDSEEMADILAELTGKSTAVNIRGDNFLELDIASNNRGGIVVDAQGDPVSLLDAVGEPFELVFNTTYSSEGIELPLEYQGPGFDINSGDTPDSVQAKVIIYNSGIDEEEGTADDVVSWN